MAAKTKTSKKQVARRKQAVSTSLTGALLHHRHSFRLVHHKHTHYRALAVLLVLTGVFSIGWTNYAYGAAYGVNATIPAPPLPVAATIDRPTDGMLVTSAPMTVSGTCPSNSYIKLLRNNVVAGAIICQSDNSWALDIQLVTGQNRLMAQAYNVTDQQGPPSNEIVITYEPPVTTPTPDRPAESSKDITDRAPTKVAVSPLTLATEIMYKGYFTNQLTDWPLVISGGVAPYAVQVEWGDGQSDLRSVAKAGLFDMQHTYSDAGDYKNSFNITVTATDAEGRVTMLELFTIIAPATTGEGSSGLVGGASAKSGDLPPSVTGLPSTADAVYETFKQLAVPAYATAVVATTGFWLGTMQQAGTLTSHFHLGRHRWW